eukprot:scaffold2917_cov191-Amphora_coffeaeformis.AAC.28
MEGGKENDSRVRGLVTKDGNGKKEKQADAPFPTEEQRLRDACKLLAKAAYKSPNRLAEDSEEEYKRKRHNVIKNRSRYAKKLMLSGGDGGNVGDDSSVGSNTSSVVSTDTHHHDWQFFCGSWISDGFPRKRNDSSGFAPSDSEQRQR